MRWTLLLCVLVACSSPPRSDGLLTVQADTLLQAGNEQLARPLDLVVSPSGNLLIADMGLHAVSVITPEGQRLRVIGREGSGPGELLIPRSLAIAGETIRLVDAGNDRIAVFDTTGRFLQTVPGFPGLSVAGAAFSASGDGLYARHGRDSTLARRFTAGGQLGSKLGRPRAPVTPFDIDQIKADLAASRVPENLRNHSLPALGPNGDAWVLLLVEGRVLHFSPADSLLWDVPLPDSVLTRLREGNYARARAETKPDRFPFPTVFLTARVVGSDLWILLREPEGHFARLAVLDAVGRWSQWWELRGATDISAFDLDSTRRILYLLDASEGTVLWAQLPPGR